jgi:hypothetical protein
MDHIRMRGEDLVDFVLDTQDIIPMMTEEKVRMLLAELDMIMEDYTRDIAIVYISGNYSSRKHLCSIILRGKHDHEIKDAMAEVRETIVNELKARKNKVA